MENGAGMVSKTVVALCVALAIAAAPLISGAAAAGGSEPSQRDIDAAVASLANAGVATYASAQDTTPIDRVTGPTSPEHFLLWQVRNMALEAANGNGLTGADIDKMSALPESLPPFSKMIAVWAKGYTSPAARAAKTLIREPDWQHPQNTMFPTLVLALFIADLTRGTAKSATPHARGADAGTRVAMTHWSRPVAVITCQGITTTVDDAITGVFDGLRSLSGNGAFRFIVNVLQLAATVIVNNQVLNLFSFLQKPIEIIAIMTQISSLLKAWTVSVVANPNIADAVLGPGSLNFDATADTHRTQVPPAINCALQIIGIDFNALVKSESAVQWDTQDPFNLGHTDGHDNKLDANDQATMTWIVNRQPQQFANGRPVCRHMRGIAAVFPGEVKSLVDALKAAIKPSLPPGTPDFLGVQAAIDAFFSQQAASATARLQTLLKAQSNALATVVVHEQVQATPSPQPSPRVGGCLSQVSVGGALGFPVELVEPACSYAQRQHSPQERCQIDEPGDPECANLDSSTHQMLVLATLFRFPSSKYFDAAKQAPGFNYNPSFAGGETLSSSVCQEDPDVSHCGTVIARRNGIVFEVYVGYKGDPRPMCESQHRGKHPCDSNLPKPMDPLHSAQSIAALALESIALLPTPGPAPSPVANCH
jgi:hypothetical protein